MNKTLTEVTETVKKLLRLAERGTEHEKKIAMEKAMKVAQGYHLDISLINPNEDEIEQKIGKAVVECGGRISTKTRYIGRLLKKHFNVSFIMSGSQTYGRTIVFIGFEQDVEMAKYLLSMLNSEFDRLWKTHSKYNNEGVRNKASYFYGLYLGLGEILDENKTTKMEEKVQEVAEETSEKAEDVRHKFALAIVNKEEAVQKEVKRLFPNLQNVSMYTNVRNYSTVEAGRIAGRKISLARPLTMGQIGCLSH